MTRLLLIVIVLTGLSNFVLAQEPSCRGSFPASRALNSRSDTMDVLHYDIHLDIIDFTNKTIAGYTTVNCTPKINGISSIDLDLLSMTIDSVKVNAATVTYSYNDTLLRVNFPVAVNPSDTLDVTVFYHGIPQMDPSGWGGFYFQSGYAFNLGVGFEANPHNFGRTWHPCFDNFVERATYDFYIRTIDPNRAHCNGVLISETVIAPDTLLRHWKMTDPIPTYLACVAVADYTVVHMNHNGMSGNIPVELVARPADTNGVKASFLHLPDAIDAYESAYGPYVWDKVGYSMVPFSSGAMEHATNIAYPRVAATGSLAYETLMAHELAHHWWGDLATCETAEDMWINEGWANYSEHIFLEHVYGWPAYIAAVKENLEDVVHYVHLRENGFRAVSGIPHQYTYGDHVYKKGAVVAHALRGYLGDSLFFSSIKTFLAANQFTHVSSTDMMNQLTAISGKNLVPFFNDWVFSPGFTHFAVDSVKSVPAGGQFNVTVYLKQRIFGAPALYTGVPLEIDFVNNQFISHRDTFTATGALTQVNFTVPFAPEFVRINPDNRIPFAGAEEQFYISSTGTHALQLAHVNLVVTSVADSVLFEAAHHWVGADAAGINQSLIRFSPNHYWTIDGVWKSGFSANAKFYYDGRTVTSGGGGYFDHDLLGLNEDSVILLYRAKPGDHWVEYPDYTINTIGSSSQKFGFVDAINIKKGQYTFGYGDRTALGVEEIKSRGSLQLFPNPTDGRINIKLPEPAETFTVSVTDTSGKLLLREKFKGGQCQVIVPDYSGMVHVTVTTTKHNWSGNVLITR